MLVIAFDMGKLGPVPKCSKLEGERVREGFYRTVTLIGSRQRLVWVFGNTGANLPRYRVSQAKIFLSGDMTPYLVLAN